MSSFNNDSDFYINRYTNAIITGRDYAFLSTREKLECDPCENANHNIPPSKELTQEELWWQILHNIKGAYNNAKMIEALQSKYTIAKK